MKLISDKSVECVKNVDWTKEFSSWHIKWNVGVITDDDMGNRKYSPPFYIPPVDTKLMNASHLFNLAMWIPKSQVVSADLLVKVDFPVPIIHRFALSHNDQEILLTNSHVEVKGNGNRQLLVEFDGSLLKRDGHLVVHCWLDIPTAVIKKIKHSLSRNIQVPWNVSNFLKKSVELYKSVIGENQETTHSDVTLVISKRPIKSGGRFHCHKNILTGASPMFATMFSMNQWKEGEDGTVDIKDIDEDTIKSVLYHIYTGNFKKAEKLNLPNLVYAADKYQLNDLKVWAEIQLMAAKYTDSERIDCLIFAQRHQLRQLQAVCILMLSTNVHLLESDEFKEKLSKEMREEIMKIVVKRQLCSTQISIGK